MIKRFLSSDSFKRSVSINLVATVLQRGFLLCSMIVLARLFDQSVYGKFSYVYSNVAMFCALASTGISVTATKKLSEHIGRNKEAVDAFITISIVLCTALLMVFGAIVLFGAPYLCEVIIKKDVVVELQLSLAFIVFSTYCNLLSGFFAGFKSFGSIAVVNSVQGVGYFVFAVIGGWYWGVPGAVSGLGGGALLGLMVALWSFRRLVREQGVRFRIPSGYMRSFFAFMIPALAAGLLVAPVNWYGATLLVSTGSGFTEMATYNAAYQWFALLIFIPNVLSSTALPYMSDLFGANRLAELKSFYNKVLFSQLKLLVPVVLVLSIFSPFILSIYGEAYTSSWFLFVVIVVSALVAATHNLQSNLLAAIDKMKVYLATNIIWAVSYVVAVNVGLASGMGGLALAYALLFANVLKFGVAYYAILRVRSVPVVKE